jgi:hypothetical protein
MPLASSLIRTYTSQDAYAQDATRLARLGYVVASVVDEPVYRNRLFQVLFGSVPKRLVVTYSDRGAASPL